MITLYLVVAIIMLFGLVSWFGYEVGREVRRYKGLSRQYSNMILYWEDKQFHPERKMCKKHAVYNGKNQPAGKCPQCGIMIRYDDEKKFTFPVRPTTFGRVKKVLEKLLVRAPMNRRFRKTPAVMEKFFSVDPKKIFIINVVFYEADMVELHYESLKKFLRDPFEYFVLDNTDEVGRSERVRNYCLSQKINYVRLPAHDAWARWGDSSSHGLALNWNYRNIVERFKPEVFGLMDGDLFPTQPVSIRECMQDGDAWGIVTDRRPFWHFWGPVYYVWPGLSFFRTKRFKGRTPNFMAGWGVDTGGRELVDGPKVFTLPEVYDLHSASWFEVAPDVYTRMYGIWNHFTGASWQPTGLKGQMQWMWGLIKK